MLNQTLRWTAPAAALGFVCAIGVPTRAETVYDNLTLDSEATVLPTQSEGRFAQQFLLQGGDTVTEVTVRLLRSGNPTGALSFELWSDNGFDQPGAKVAAGDLGTIDDVAAVPVDPTDFVLANAVSALDPEEAYWVVANYSNVDNDLDNDIGWSVVTSDAGSNGATYGYMSDDGGLTWQAHGDNSFFFDFWHQMAVVTLPGPGDSAIAAGALVGFLLVRFRREGSASR